MRIPDRVFRIIERVYREQDRIRRAELRAAVEKEDRDMRAYYARLRQEHAAGNCGGAEAGCCYVPCIPKVSSW